MKRWRRWGMIVAAMPLIALVLLLGTRLLVRQSVAKDASITSPGGIDVLERVEIGGVVQWISIRGQSQRNPVVLWLHGGPGSTSLPLAPKYDRLLIEDFTIAHWDQRGAGKSFGDVPVASMTVAQFVSDVLDVAEHLRERFGKNSLYLVGHSWGTNIGVLAAAQRPDLFATFVGIGQSVSSRSEEIGYEWVTERAAREAHEEAEAALASLGPPPWTTIGEYQVYGRWVAAFGGTSHSLGMGTLMGDVATSPAYSLRDVVGFVRGQSFSVSTMLKNGELDRVDLTRDAPRIEIPVFFFQGRHDYNTPGEAVEEYYSTLDAPAGKELIWFENSAHFPQWEEPERFREQLLRVKSVLEHSSNRR